MTVLKDIVQVERRFALSARLDADLNGSPPLTGYVLQASVRKALETMVDALAEGGRTAFTWTGPYGGGKSCAALLVANLVGGRPAQQAQARELVGPELAGAFDVAFPKTSAGWRVLALTGRRADFAEDLTRAAALAFDWPKAQVEAALRDDRILIDGLIAEGERSDGVLVMVDELGKFFDHAIAGGGDVHFLQDLSERAARAGRRVVLVGVLHQAFEQYADRLSRRARDEWSKIQGRFQNIPFLAQPDEVAALLARAIVCSRPPPSAKALAQLTAQAVAERRPVDVEGLAETLTEAWPLHPATALLLGPVSRQRFAQNERSVFGFLSSAEPYGFQAHLTETAADEPDAWFGPDRLWDYLVANFGSALNTGPDGARLSLALEAVERASLQGPLCTRLTKAAALIEFFRNGSGLAVADDVLALCAPTENPKAIASALETLVQRAILIRQPRLGGYALFAGSDFDLDEAIRKVGDKLDPAALADLPSRMGVGPVAAKRHYFETGALRTFDVEVLLAQEVPAKPDAWAQATAVRLAATSRRASGLILLLLPDPQTFEAKLENAAKALSAALEDKGLVAALAAPKRGFLFREHAGELLAIERVEASHPQLEGDRIARREVAGRHAVVLDRVRQELLEVFADAAWWALGKRDKTLDGAPLAATASEVAGRAFEDAPIVQSELLYRDRPSSSAMAGLRALTHAMVTHADREDLGIRNYPAERGLYLTILRSFGLHRQDAEGVWRFQDPDNSAAGKSLQPAWRLLTSGRRLRLDDLYARWGRRPIGMKRGVMPVFVLAFLLAHRSSCAVYVDGFYQALIDDVFVDRMLQDPKSVEVRRVTRSGQEAAFILRLSKLLARPGETLEAEALPVASALYQRVHGLPLWTQRTSRLGERARRVRDLALKANDPEALLFDDLKTVLSEASDPAAAVAEALSECEGAYELMLERLRLKLAEQLGVDPATFEGLGPRAAVASGVTADLRLEAFAMRAGGFESGAADIEGLASLLVHKPARNWTDAEHDQAVFELAKLSRLFREAEVFAGVKGRTPTAKAISVMVGLDPKTLPVVHSFEVTAQEMADADRLADDLVARVRAMNARSTVELAALARAVERLSAEEPRPNHATEVA